MWVAIAFGWFIRDPLHAAAAVLAWCAAVILLGAYLTRYERGGWGSLDVGTELQHHAIGLLLTLALAAAAWWIAERRRNKRA